MSEHHVKGLAAIPVKVIVGGMFLFAGVFASAVVDLECARDGGRLPDCVVRVGTFALVTLREQAVGSVREVVSETRVDDSITTMGRTTKPRRELLVLRGDVNLDYHFLEDQGRISDYLGDASEPVLFVPHPPTGLRKYGGWALGGFGLLILVGVVIELMALAFGKRVTTNLTET